MSGIVVIVIARHVRCFCPADSQSMSYELVSPYLQLSLSLLLLYKFRIGLGRLQTAWPNDVLCRFRKRAHPWWWWRVGGWLLIRGAVPKFTLKYSAWPSLIVTCVSQYSYISWMILMYVSGTIFFRRLHHISSMSARSYAFSSSTKTMWSYLFFSLYFSCIILNANIGSLVDLPGLIPNWLSAILGISLSRASIILTHSSIVWLISSIPL